VGIYLADQTMAFLQSMVVGMLLALLFDGFRISRIAIPTAGGVVFMEDVLFFLVCAVVSFLLMMTATEGQVRIFILIGEGLGATLYTLTVGRAVMAVSKTIIAIIKGIALFIFKWILTPVWRLIYRIVILALQPFYFLSGVIKKNIQKYRFRLKVRRLIVYNHYKQHLCGKRGKTGEKKCYEESTEGP